MTQWFNPALSARHRYCAPAASTPVIERFRQPPPATTSRHRSDRSRWSCWQNRVALFEPVARAPRSAQVPFAIAVVGDVRVGEGDVEARVGDVGGLDGVGVTVVELVAVVGRSDAGTGASETNDAAVLVVAWTEIEVLLAVVAGPGLGGGNGAEVLGAEVGGRVAGTEGRAVGSGVAIASPVTDPSVTDPEPTGSEVTGSTMPAPGGSVPGVEGATGPAVISVGGATPDSLTRAPSRTTSPASTPTVTLSTMAATSMAVLRGTRVTLRHLGSQSDPLRRG